MRKFWKRQLKAKDVILVITNLDSGEVKEYSAYSLDYHFSGDILPFAIFPGTSRYELSIRRRTK